jgi:fibronectin-binding autotransporter adhesin
MNKPSASYRVSLPWLWQHPKTSAVTFVRCWLAMVALGFFATCAFATDLNWDAGTANTGTGSGNWDTTTANWWNGSSDVVWPQTSTTVATVGAVFGNGVDQPDGTYAINVDAQVAVTNIIFNNTGYALSNSSSAGIFFYNVSGQPAGVYVAAGKTADYNLPTAGFANGSGMCFGAGAGSTLNLTGAAFANGGFQPFLFGPGTNIITAGNFVSAQMDIHGPVVYNGSGIWTYNGNLLIAHNTGPGSYFGTPNTAAGSFTMNSGTFNNSNNKITIGRNGNTGAFILNGGTVNFWINDNGNANSIIALPNNDANANHGTLTVNGGTFNIGGASSVTANRDQIQMMSGGAANGATAFFTQKGGIVNDWGGILIGNTGSSTYAATSTAAITNSGGSLFIGQYGIVRGLTFPTVIYIQLSGGIVGALGNWSSILPMDLDTANGNITFECDDGAGTGHGITLSGALTGPGGFNKTGSGTLKLSGANNFAGTTVVSNGTLQIATGTLPTSSGPNILDGSAGGLPIESVDVLNTGQYWTNNGDLTYAAGNVRADFNYDNSFQPSTVTAPIQVSGNVNFAVTPSVTIEGSAIPVGTYPLIKYGGSVSGTMPTAPTSLPVGATATISNSPAAKTIYLVVTGSLYSSAYAWGVGSGYWDFSSKNWRRLGVLTNYVDASPAQFDDTAGGPFPITVTNIVTVNPPAITISTTNAYIFTGNGTIAGSASLTLASSGTLTMAGTNTYSGGTTIKAGQLNINYGGDGSLNSAIGTGALTNDLGAKMDNTSGHAVTLITPIAQYWNDDWTFVGSTNFNTGPGAVTLGNNNVILTVVSNNLEVDGAIGDNGNNYKLTKSGNGSLTLTGGSTFNGGFELFSGQVNLGNSSAGGFGVFTIDGGSIDNISGGDLTISPISSVWQGSFSYLGTSNNLDFGSGQITASGGGSFSVNVVTNTLITEGNVVPGNNLLHKTGQGTWDITGFGSSAQNLNLSVDEGTVKLDKIAGPSINGVAFGLIVQSNALAIITGSDGDEISDNNAVTLNMGGVLDLFGNSETVGSLANSNGILRNGLAGSTAVLTASAMTLNGTNCVFDVPDSAAALTITATDVTGGGSLVKTGLGLLNLSTNSYTGDTTISNGTLVLNFPNIATNSTVTVSTNATLATNGLLTLNFPNGETNIVAALVLGGVGKAPGLYSATTDPLYISGSGSLQVGTGTAPAPLTSLAFTARPVISGTSLTISGTNTGAGTVYLLTSTNVAAPISTWTPVWTNVLSGSGSFTTNLSDAVNPALNQQFYLLSNTNN